MRLLSHTDGRKDREDGLRKLGQERGEYYPSGLGCSLGLLGNYLKGASYRPGRTNKFAVGAPVALCCFNNRDDIVNNHQGVGAAYTDT
jgi:hypothetical protein